MYRQHRVDLPPEPGFANVNDWEQHARFYALAANQPALDFLTAGSEERLLDPEEELPEDQALLDQVVARVEAAGADAVVVDLTTDDVKRLGLHTVKAVIPEAAILNP